VSFVDNGLTGVLIKDSKKIKGEKMGEGGTKNIPRGLRGGGDLHDL